MLRSMPTTNTDRTLTLHAVHTLDDEPPGIPEGASGWERQELRRYWGNAMHALRDTAVLATELYERTRTLADPIRPNAEGGGLVYEATKATAAMIEYHALHDAVLHRLALQAKADGAPLRIAVGTAEGVQLIDFVAPRGQTTDVPGVQAGFSIQVTVL